VSARVIQIGMIGVGGWGTVGHLNAYKVSPHARTVAVCDVVGERAEQVAAEWHVERAYSDYRELLADPAVEAVDIATPNNTHYEIALAALAAGKHVMCEKPLAITVPEAREMVDAAVTAGVHNSVNFVHRYVPSARYVKQLLDEGVLGRIFHLNLSYQQGWLVDPAFPRVWRLSAEVAGTGVLGDLGSHVIDLARWWLGSELTAVAARLTTFQDRRPRATAGALISAAQAVLAAPVESDLVSVDVDDEATWLATFANGAQGSFFTSRNATARRNYQRAEIYGSEGAIVFENEVRDSVQASLGSAMTRRNAWATLPVPPGLMREEGKNSMHYFPEDIATGGQVGPTFVDGLRAQEAMAAIERAARDRAWVPV
jgi:predicted dehydrogenase